MPQRQTTTKAATVTKILSRAKGATLVEIGKSTGWQPHSCRAFLTGLRKKGSVLKEQRSDGSLAYRVGLVVNQPASNVAEAADD
jgi:hypothetical protein